jgi:hypothetical protein
MFNAAVALEESGLRSAASAQNLASVRRVAAADSAELRAVATRAETRRTARRRPSVYPIEPISAALQFIRTYARSAQRVP